MKIAIDTHTHTVHSGHAFSTINENMLYASQNKLDLICMTDHAPNLPGGAHQFHFFNLKVIPSEMYGVKLLKGVELNILDQDGTVDTLSDEQSVYDRLEFRIASLHPPCISPNSATDFTKAVIKAIEKNNIDCLGHLGDPRFPMNNDDVIKCAIENNVLIELNNASLNPQSTRFDVSSIMGLIESCYKYNAKITFGSDSHFFTEIGNFEHVYKIYEDNNLSYDNVITTDVNKFLDFLKLNRGN